MKGAKRGEQGASAPSPLFPHMNVHVMCSIGQVQNNKVGGGGENVTTKPYQSFLYRHVHRIFPRGGGEN